MHHELDFTTFKGRYYGDIELWQDVGSVCIKVTNSFNETTILELTKETTFKMIEVLTQLAGIKDD